MIKQQVVLHAIPNGIGWGSAPWPQVIDVTPLSHGDQSRVQKELEAQGYFVQTWFPQDPTEMLVRAEMRDRIQKEQEGEDR